jgi:hypothetical protein
MQHEQSMLIEDSAQIAWDYLDRAGEIRDPLPARRFLLAEVETMFKQGVRSRLLLSNRAIMAYHRHQQQSQAA